jgi:hypothetical protein
VSAERAGSVDVREVADWLRDIGYGVDFSAPDYPLPEPLRRPLAESWWRREQAEFPEETRTETVESYMKMLDEEGAW